MKEKPRKRLIQLSFEPGGYSWEFLVGGVPPGSPNPDPILDQKMSFFTAVFRPGLQNPYPFSDSTCKKLCHYGLDQNSKQKDSLKSISNSHTSLSLLPGYSFGIETINTFIHSRSSLESHTRLQTKMGKPIPVFRPKRRKIPALWGGAQLQDLYK